MRAWLKSSQIYTPVEADVEDHCKQGVGHEDGSVKQKGNLSEGEEELIVS